MTVRNIAPSVPKIVTMTLTIKEVPNSGVVRTYWIVLVWKSTGQNRTLPAMTLPSLLNAFATRFRTGSSMIRPTRTIAVTLIISNMDTRLRFLAFSICIHPVTALPNPLSGRLSRNEVRGKDQNH